MAFLTLDQLPFVGMSYEFRGEKEGAPFSSYIVTAKPGQGPPLHTHPYVEVDLRLKVAPPSRSVMKPAKSNPAALSSSLRIHRIDSLTPAKRRCAKSTSMPARDLSKQTSPVFVRQNVLDGPVRQGAGALCSDGRTDCTATG